MKFRTGLWKRIKSPKNEVLLEKMVTIPIAPFVGLELCFSNDDYDWDEIIQKISVTVGEENERQEIVAHLDQDDIAESEFSERLANYTDIGFQVVYHLPLEE